MSKAVRQLEQVLGAALLRRGPRGPPLGDEILVHCRSLLAEVDAIAALASGATAAGPGRTPARTR